MTESNSKHNKTILLRFSADAEQDIILHLDNQKNKNGYIKRLIREDISSDLNSEIIGSPEYSYLISGVQDAVCDLIEQSDYTRQWFAGVLDISRQALFAKMQKKNFTLADIERIYDALNYNVALCISKKETGDC